MHFDMWTGRRCRRARGGAAVQVSGEPESRGGCVGPRSGSLSGMADDPRAIITDAVYVIAVDDGRSRASRVRWFVARLAAFVAVGLAVAVLSLRGDAGHRRHRVKLRV